MRLKLMKFCTFGTWKMILERNRVEMSQQNLNFGVFGAKIMRRCHFSKIRERPGVDVTLRADASSDRRAFKRRVVERIAGYRLVQVSCGCDHSSSRYLINKIWIKFEIWNFIRFDDNFIVLGHEMAAKKWRGDTWATYRSAGRVGGE